MTEETRCKENAHAERLNGILKQEYEFGCSFRGKRRALTTIDEAVSPCRRLFFFHIITPLGHLL
jgi:hypothetical protein